jgi:hypothetical protein
MQILQETNWSVILVFISLAIISLRIWQLEDRIASIIKEQKKDFIKELSAEIESHKTHIQSDFQKLQTRSWYIKKR